MNTLMSVFLLVFMNVYSIASSAQSAKEMNLVDYSYVESVDGTKWSVSMDDKSVYSKDGVPTKLQGQVRVESVKNKMAQSKTYTLPGFPFEDGVIMVTLDKYEVYFMVITRGPELADNQRRVHLISTACSGVIAHFDATMEEPEDLSVKASNKDFSVSFADLNGKKTSRTWTRPASGKSPCGHGFR